MNNLTVTASPHLHGGSSTRAIMRDVIIALFPALIAGSIFFGPRALLVTAVTVLSCVLGEYVTRKIIKRDNSIGDLSAVVTGMLLAFNLPVSIPIWMAAVGGLVAIVIVKQLFGGIGQNFANPAIVGRIVLMVSFPAAMSNFTAPLFKFAEADALTAATPLVTLAEGGKMPGLLNLFLGAHGGCIGETCSLALLLGGIYLVIRRVISPVIPLCFIGTTLLVTFIAGYNPLYELLSGGLLLGAVFMATDYSTSPINLKGRILFGIGCGLITALIRLFASLPEGVSYSILLMNILSPHLERITTPKPFGWKEAGSK